jgi:dihydropyrimidine dehydrogenase (NAD+) subunit PreT
VLGLSCARVCPVDVLCAGACVLSLQYRPPIEIGRLQRYATEPFVGTSFFGRPLAKRTGRKIALVGAGPASLACAFHLVGLGHEPVIFEKRAVPGGLNLFGIAPYKMHADDCLRETEWILSSGIELKTGVEIGKDVACERLVTEYDAVFVGVGMGKDSSLGIPGEHVPGVLSAIEMIERIKLDASLRLDGLESAAVIGGGNTATDVARELAHLGVADVSILYRRTELEMPGYAHELKAARAAGVRFIEKTLPVRMLEEKGRLKGLVVARAEKAHPIPGTEREFEAQMVVVAIGQAGEAGVVSKFPGVKCDSNGRVIVDEKTGRTGNPRVFAGGDCINGGKEVVNAVADGKRAAIEIDKTLGG